MFKVNNKNTRTTPMGRSGVFIVNFEHISRLNLVFLFLNAGWMYVTKPVIQRFILFVKCSWVRTWSCISCYRMNIIQRCFCRNPHSQMFFKIGALKSFAIFAGKHLWWRFFLIKLQAATLWKETPRQVHSC